MGGCQAIPGFRQRSAVDIQCDQRERGRGRGRGAPGRGLGGWGELRGECGAGNVPAEGAPGEGPSPHWADKAPLFFPPSPQPKKREGEAGAETNEEQQ